MNSRLSNKGQRNIFSIFCLSCFLFTLTGCGLMGGKRNVNIEESPPYYNVPSNNYVMAPMDHPTMSTESPKVTRDQVSSRGELEKLELEAEDWSREQERQKALKAEKEEKKKKGFWNWFSSGDKMAGMSQEAKAVNDSLEQRRIDGNF